MKSKIIIPKVATLDNIALELGDVMSVRNLTIAPLYGDSSFNGGAILLDDAIENGKTGGFSVTESQDVDSLVIKNDLGERVFIAEGQVLEGSSQNRMTIYSTLIPGHSGEIILPVRCVQRRQGLIRSRYSGSGTVIMPALRGNNPDETLATMSYRRPYHAESAQDTTWTAIATATQILNRTHILDVSDIRRENYCDVLANAKLEDYLDELKKTADPDQIGYVAAVARSDGKIDLYTDFFGSHQHLSGLYERLLASLAFVARLHNQDSVYNYRREIALRGVSKDGLSVFLETMAKAEVSPIRKVGEPQTPLEKERDIPSYMWLDPGSDKVKRRTVGEGTLYRLQKPVDGSVLLVEDKYVQAFAKHTLN